MLKASLNLQAALVEKDNLIAFRCHRAEFGAGKATEERRNPGKKRITEGVNPNIV